MNLNDNYLKEHLKHVYWLNGGCCAGKTTMTKKFVAELGFQTVEDDVLKYRPYTSHADYPALQYPHPGLDWNQWFNKPDYEHCEWLLRIAEEIMDFFIVDLLRLPADRPVIVDLGIMPGIILPFIPRERMNINRNMIRFSQDIRDACVRNGIKAIERTAGLSPEEQFRLVREHFGL